MKMLLAFAFFASCLSVAHADWVKIDASIKDAALYADKSAAEKSGTNTLKLWHIVDYTAPQNYDGKPFRSIKANYEYDCEHRRFRELIRILHKEPMGNGLTVYWTHGLWSWTHDPSAWIQPEAGSIDAELVGAACTG